MRPNVTGVNDFVKDVMSVLVKTNDVLFVFCLVKREQTLINEERIMTTWNRV